jgi:hypothetical protein
MTMRMMNEREIEACQQIGRNEVENATRIGLPELDALCFTAKEALRLQKKLSKYERRKPSFQGTVFHHFPDVATVAVRQLDDDKVRVGVALVALPQYLDVYGRRIPPAELTTHLNTQIKEVRPGDQFNHVKGRIISHGRALKCRGYSSIQNAEVVHNAILNIREREKEVLRLTPLSTDEFDPLFLAWTAARAELRAAIVSAFCTEEEG